MKTKEEMLQMNDEELIKYHNSLVDESKSTDDYKVHDRNEKQMELFREVWIEKNGLKQVTGEEDLVLHRRTSRNNF